jgi:hypothetical protein
MFSWDESRVISHLSSLEHGSTSAHTREGAKPYPRFGGLRDGDEAIALPRRCPPRSSRRRRRTTSPCGGPLSLSRTAAPSVGWRSPSAVELPVQRRPPPGARVAAGSPPSPLVAPPRSPQRAPPALAAARPSPPALCCVARCCHPHPPTPSPVRPPSPLRGSSPTQPS